MSNKSVDELIKEYEELTNSKLSPNERLLFKYAYFIGKGENDNEIEDNEIVIPEEKEQIATPYEPYNTVKSNANTLYARYVDIRKCIEKCIISGLNYNY